MSGAPDGWDWVKSLCAFGTIAGFLSWLAGEKDGGPFAAASFVGGLVCSALEPPICGSCDVRTNFDPKSGYYRCPKCGGWHIK